MTTGSPKDEPNGDKSSDAEGKRPLTITEQIYLFDQSERPDRQPPLHHQDEPLDELFGPVAKKLRGKRKRGKR
jgi:hypothetical protein